MLIDKVQVAEGSQIVNAVIDGDTSFPSNPDTGELFYRSDSNDLYVYTGSWTMLATSTITFPIGGDSGNAGAPTYSFTSSTDSGMYLTGGLVLAFSSGGTASLQIETDGTLNVSAITDYEDQVTDDDDIPNKLYVDEAITTAHVPAGSDTQIQFNNSGVFGASGNLTWNDATLSVTGGGSPLVPVIDITGQQVKITSDGPMIDFINTSGTSNNEINFRDNTQKLLGQLVFFPSQDQIVLRHTNSAGTASDGDIVIGPDQHGGTTTEITATVPIFLPSADPVEDRHAAHKGYVDDVATAGYTRQQYVATADQTTFAINYEPGFVDVYLNGTKLVPTTDFTATNGTSVILIDGAEAGDNVDLVAFTAGSVVNELNFVELTATTTDATETELVGSGPLYYTIPDNETHLVEVLIVARRTDVTGENAMWKVLQGIENTSSGSPSTGTTALVGSPDTTVVSNTPSWAISLTADDTNDRLAIKVTGAGSKTINWKATITSSVVS